MADLFGHDPAGTDTLAVDGKSARGSRLGANLAAHLLAATTGTDMTVTQLRAPEKTNEITSFAALLKPYDLQGVTVTGDALHIQRDHTRFLVEARKAHYAMSRLVGEATARYTNCGTRPRSLGSLCIA